MLLLLLLLPEDLIAWNSSPASLEFVADHERCRRIVTTSLRMNGVLHYSGIAGGYWEGVGKENRRDTGRLSTQKINMNGGDACYIWTRPHPPQVL